jgi:hypothetical protein
VHLEGVAYRERRGLFHLLFLYGIKDTHLKPPPMK